jgi:MFS family permease
VSAPRERLFTAPFFAMCGYSFTVFLSLFQLVPTAPFHIQDLGGSRAQAGLFLGLLTYSCAFSAVVTGALADRLGRTRMLLVCSLAIAGFTALYSVAPSVLLMLVLVPVHGIVWSGLLSASGAYMTSILPAGRRVEGIAYWGMASVIALAIGPVLGLWLYQGFGWFWLCASAVAMNLVMAYIATRLEEPARPPVQHEKGPLIEWKVLILSIPLFMYTYSYGALTSFSAIYADELGIRPKSLFLTTLAVVILVTRPVLGLFGDRFSHRRLFPPCLVLIALGLVLLAFSSSRPMFAVAAIVYGLGYGTAYPVYVGYATHTVSEHRRGAAFGAILAAFDTGIGTGSTLTGWISSHGGLALAFGVAACLAACALPAFLFADRHVSRMHGASPDASAAPKPPA